MTFARHSRCAFRSSISNEGLEQSYATGRDQDPFDAVCDHLIVEHLPSANIVGTYRLQTGALVVLFPEGPSSDGQTVLPFKSSLLEPAARQAHPLSTGLIHFALRD